MPFTDLGSKWIFGGAHWGHTSLECGQQVPANVGKLRRWSRDSPSPARWSEDDTNLSGL